MPGTTTESKLTQWDRALLQFVKDRLKLKQCKSRIALALHNAKIHRPTLFLTAAKPSGFRSVAFNNVSCQQIPAYCSEVKRMDCELDLINYERNARGNNSIETTFRLPAYHLEKSALKKLPCCSCCGRTSLPLDTIHNPLRRGKEKTKNDPNRTMQMKTVSIKPWENDGVKVPSEGQKPTTPRLASLLRESCSRLSHLNMGYLEHSAARQGKNKASCQGANGRIAVDALNSKLPNPGRIAPHNEHLCWDYRSGDTSDCLSGILLVSSKIPPAHCSLRDFPAMSYSRLLGRTNETNPSFHHAKFTKREKGHRICAECMEASKQVSRKNSKFEPDNLTRLKRRVKVREHELLQEEKKCLDRSQQALYNDRPGTRGNEPQERRESSCIGETVALPKLYLSHHSSHEGGPLKKPKKSTRKVGNSDRLSELRSTSLTKQTCYKLARITKTCTCADSTCRTIGKKGKTSRSESESSSTAVPKLTPRRKCLPLLPVETLRVFTPLRGFTPFDELPPSPMLW